MSLTPTVLALMEATESLRFVTGAHEGKARYKFKPQIKIVLAKRLRALTQALEIVDEHRKEMIGKYKLADLEQALKDAQAEGDKADRELAAARAERDLLQARREFDKEWQVYMAAPIELECAQVKFAELDLKDNDIPTSHLTALDWLLQGMDEDAAKE